MHRFIKKCIYCSYIILYTQFSAPIYGSLDIMVHRLKITTATSSADIIHVVLMIKT